MGGGVLVEQRMFYLMSELQTECTKHLTHAAKNIYHIYVKLMDQ